MAEAMRAIARQSVPAPRTIHQRRKSRKKVPPLLPGIAFLGTAASPLGNWSSHLDREFHLDRMGSDPHPVMAVPGIDAVAT